MLGLLGSHFIHVACPLQSLQNGQLSVDFGNILLDTKRFLVRIQSRLSHKFTKGTKGKGIREAEFSNTNKVT